MKGFLTKEIIDGFERWCKLACYAYALWIVLDILPYLPDEIAGPIVDKLLGFLK